MAARIYLVQRFRPIFKRHVPERGKKRDVAHVLSSRVGLCWRPTSCLQIAGHILNLEGQAPDFPSQIAFVRMLTDRLGDVQKPIIGS